MTVTTSCNNEDGEYCVQRRRPENLRGQRAGGDLISVASNSNNGVGGAPLPALSSCLRSVFLLWKNERCEGFDLTDTEASIEQAACNRPNSRGD